MKVKRDAFLYMDPSGPNKKAFGQCATCKMNVPMKDGHRCSILGIEIDAGDSCGLYVPGKQVASEAEHIDDTVSPEEAGFVERQVRCENCAFFSSPSTCGLFVKLNRALPNFMDLDIEVDPKGCCNAQIPKGRGSL